ncbi:TIR-like protein FxsC [Streptomyces sp. DSM 40750]|uniref:TIR-like protein FxsC n=1 Tax=Streptomyces sp. DSM 40750 TaxID=2801030 RepID=UPI0027D462B4|nr:TIR-like protein FxsC [Streptomyces sp. DSM 40750]
MTAALNTAAPGLDGTALAELLWLASRMDAEAEEVTAGQPGDRRTRATRTPESAADESGSSPVVAGHDVHEHLAGGAVRIRGDAVAPARASGLPRTLEVTRALRPWKRQWPRGRRSALDIDATVNSYARSGELIPVFSPAPERWFDLVLVVDCSPAMQVWRETVMDFTAVLDRLGAFRTLRVHELHLGVDGLELRDGQGRLVAPGRLGSPDGRQLVVVVSDCVAPGWRDAPVWRRLREWALSAPLALLNPLPTKLWRRTGLDLPSARVTAIAPGLPNSRLLFQLPLLPYENEVPGDGDWLPVPVLSLSPHSLTRWSRTLMRTAPEGAGAVLVPRGGRMEHRLRQRSGAVAADRFLRTASPSAARLAVLCSIFDRLSTRLLHVIRQELVPEATAADAAELLTSGLFTLTTAENGVVELSLPETVQRTLRRELAEHEVWRVNRALSRHMASQHSWGGQLPAVVPSHRGRTELRAAVEAFGQLSEQTLELLGLPTRASTVPRPLEEVEHAARPVPGGSPPPEAEEVSANRPYFFLSYARTPLLGPGGGDPDHWVTVLFRDLCDHIMALTDLPAGAAPGFMDREPRSGEDWPDEFSENLATCRVFVPLYSPRYFTSEMCGREWYAFQERIVQAKAVGAGDIPAILPVLWTPVAFDQLPESARHIQMYHASFGERYRDHGIYGLIKLNRLRDEYDEVVLSLAQRIVRVAQETPLPPSRPRPYATTPSAFKPRGEGPRRIQVTVAAPTRGTLPAHRDTRPYGEAALDWNPYFLESTRPLPQLVEELLRSLDYRVTLSSLTDEAPDTAGPAERDVDTVPSDCPGILLVDRWTLLDQERRLKLRAIDTIAHPWLGMMVPWSRHDVQCHSEEGRRLEVQMEDTLPLLLEHGRRSDSEIAVNGVPTLKAFTDVLPALVAFVTQQFLRHAQAHPPSGPPPLPRPMLRLRDEPTHSEE